MKNKSDRSWIGRFALLTMALVLAIVFLQSRAAEADVLEPNLVIIGDSVTVSEATVPTQWTNMVADALELTPKRYAASGSGMIKPGGHCTTGTYSSRLGSLEVQKPQKVIIEDVIGDANICVNGDEVKTTFGDIESRTSSFMSQLANAADDIGLARSEVYILTPETYKIRDFNFTRLIAERQAVARGFTFIEDNYIFTSQLKDDGIHPNSTNGQVRMSSIALAEMQ